MLLHFKIFVVFVVFKTVVARNPLATLDIDGNDKEHFKIKSLEFDNVYYEQFTPARQYFVRNVNQSGSKIWESDGTGTCIYSLLAKSNGKPHLLYLKVDRGYKDDHLYYVKKDDSWNPIDIHEYSNSISALRKDVKIERLFALNVSSAFSYDLFTIVYASANKPYTYITPNVGFEATHVVYNSKKLWVAKNKGDRCVAAWAYMHAGSYYMIRILVTKVNEESELKTFFVIKNKWELVHTLKHNYDASEPVKAPEDFHYPNYAFNLKPLDNVKEIPNEVMHDMFSEGKKYPNVSENSEYLEYMEGKYNSTTSTSAENKATNTETNTENKDTKTNPKENKDTKTDSTQNKDKTTSETNDKKDTSTENTETDTEDTLEPFDPNDYQPLVKVIRKKSCLELDVSKRLNNYKYENLGLFDGRLQVVSYNPPPGKYFDLVKDGNMPLFVGHHLNSVCQSVNFYLKNDEFYLVEVIVRNDNKDSTRHFKKDDSRWVYLETKDFLESLDKLKHN